MVVVVVVVFWWLQFSLHTKQLDSIVEEKGKKENEIKIIKMILLWVMRK